MNLNIDFYTADELQLAADYLARVAALRARLEAQARLTMASFDEPIVQDVKPTVTQNGGSSEPAATPSAGDPAGNQPAASEHARSEAAGAVTTLPPFDGVEEAQMAAAAEAAKLKKPRKSKSETKPEPVVEAPKAEAKTLDLSVDALRAAIQAYTKENGLQAGGELLRAFNCARISELADQPDAVKIEFLTKAEAV